MAVLQVKSITNHQLILLLLAHTIKTMKILRTKVKIATFEAIQQLHFNHQAIRESKNKRASAKMENRTTFSMNTSYISKTH